jgi:hypothetical protein
LVEDLEKFKDSPSRNSPPWAEAGPRQPVFAVVKRIALAAVT